MCTTRASIWRWIAAGTEPPSRHAPPDRTRIQHVARSGSLRDFLLQTDNRVLAEASPVDRIWGVGLAHEDEHAGPRQARYDATSWGVRYRLNVIDGCCASWIAPLKPDQFRFMPSSVSSAISTRLPALGALSRSAASPHARRMMFCSVPPA
ncbi:hypothetical protein DDE05_31440 [Streptomyces cavourensis]|nr:hypothetical protein DDE05_31440 [Streptomyces cavourensis]